MQKNFLASGFMEVAQALLHLLPALVHEYGLSKAESSSNVIAYRLDDVDSWSVTWPVSVLVLYL